MGIKIKTLDEGPAELIDNSKDFRELDVNTKLTITNGIETSDKRNEVKISIGLIFEVKTDNNELIYYCMYIGQYLVTIENSLTQEEFSDFYKTPYNSFKDYFDNYKKGKNLEPLTFPKFNKDLKLTIKAFQEKIPDLIGLLPPDTEPKR